VAGFAVGGVADVCAASTVAEAQGREGESKLADHWNDPPEWCAVELPPSLAALPLLKHP
jgi:hypothetical protein